MDPGQSIGAALRDCRLAAGLSLGDLAGRVHYSKGYLSKIENGVKQASADLLRRCDTALAAGGELYGLLVDLDHPDQGNWLLEMATKKDDDGPALGRREVLAVGGSLSVLAATTSAIGPAHLAPVTADGSITAGFGAMLGELRTLGQSQPPTLLLPILDVQVRTLLSLARSARSQGQGSLLMLTSQFAEYTGWMAQEAGDDQAMARWTSLAVRCADAAGDQDLSAYAYVRYANAAMYQDDAVSTIDLAARALSGSARVRALALQRQAQGHALLGRQDDCRRALDQADALFDQMDGGAAGGASMLGTTTVADPSDLVLGWCLHDLGRSEDAVPVLERHLARIPEQARRARARVKGRLALAWAGAGDPETASTIAHQVLDDAVYVDSATVRHDLRHLGRTLNRWRSRADVQTVTPRLAQALRRPAGAGGFHGPAAE